MQRQNDSFEELKTELLERLEVRGCTPITITGYRYQCNCIFAWLKENGYGSYSKERGTAFLQNYYSKHGSLLNGLKQLINTAVGWMKPGMPQEPLRTKGMPFPGFWLNYQNYSAVLLTGCRLY